MATLKDVAKQVGVSVATVSYVLTGRGSISAEVSDKVLAAVKELGYRPNRKAQAMRTGLSKSIGMILPDLTKPYFPHLAQQVESAARKAGYAVLLVDCQNQFEAEEDGFDLLAQQGVDGIIWFPMDNKTPKSVSTINCPIVLIDRTQSGFDTVYCDYFKGGSLQAQYAIDLGHKRVGLLSGPQSIESAQKRRSGFLQSIDNQSIDNQAIGNELEVVWDIETPFSTTLNDEAIAALKENKVSMVVCADDLIAIGAMGTLTDIGLNVPSDVSIIGFDNIPWSTIVTPKLTTINQPISAIGTEAVAILTNKIKQPNITERAIILGVELIERNSTVEYSDDSSL